MDIERLKRKRQLNVQEQNALLKNKIMTEARYWRTHGAPKGLAAALESKGIDVDSSVLLNYQQDLPGCSTDFGVVLTKDGTFFEFEMDLTPTRDAMVELHAWKNITADVEIDARMSVANRPYNVKYRDVTYYYYRVTTSLTPPPRREPLTLYRDGFDTIDSLLLTGSTAVDRSSALNTTIFAPSSSASAGLFAGALSRFVPEHSHLARSGRPLNHQKESFRHDR